MDGKLTAPPAPVGNTLPAGRPHSSRRTGLRGISAAARPYTRPALLLVTHIAAGVLGAWAVCRPAEPAAPSVHQWGPITLRDPLSTPATEYEWRQLPAPEFPIPAYARFLEGVVIVLDPGHGGLRRNKPDPNVGPNGVREAEVNLQVALFLQEFLDAAGAKLQLTRERDVYLHEQLPKDLTQRIAQANQIPADLFVSIHHNAAADPRSNYSLVFFHADGQDNPASLCAARHLLTGINDALRLERHVDCAVRSDFTNTPDGYAVLRQARVPAVLVESSFHSNPEEADRLLDPVYNRMEAYGLFMGLARWAQAGLPRIALAEVEAKPGTRAAAARTPAVIQLYDGLSGRGQGGPAMKTILDQTIRVEVDGKPVNADYDAKLRQVALRVTLEELRGRRVFVDFQNIFGQHVIHPVLYFR